MTALCLWCGSQFERRLGGGKAQRFCRPACRRAFDQAARAYVVWMLETGRLTPTALRNFAQNQHRVAPDGQVASEATQVAPTEDARCAPLRGKGGEKI